MKTDQLIKNETIFRSGLSVMAGRFSLRITLQSGKSRRDILEPPIV